MTDVVFTASVGDVCATQVFACLSRDGVPLDVSVRMEQTCAMFLVAALDWAAAAGNDTITGRDPFHSVGVNRKQIVTSVVLDFIASIGYTTYRTITDGNFAWVHAGWVLEQSRANINGLASRLTEGRFTSLCQLRERRIRSERNTIARGWWRRPCRLLRLVLVLI